MINLTNIIKDSFHLIVSKKDELLTYFYIFFAVELLSQLISVYANNNTFTSFFSILLFVYLGSLCSMMYYYKLKHIESAVNKVFHTVHAKIGSILILGTLLAVGTLMGFLFFIVPGLILLSGWAIVFPVFLFERTSIIGAFKESMRLTKGSRYPILLYQLLFIVISILIESCFGGTEKNLFATFITAALLSAFTMYYNTSLFLIYAKLVKNSESV